MQDPAEERAGGLSGLHRDAHQNKKCLHAHVSRFAEGEALNRKLLNEEEKNDCMVFK